MMSEETSSSSEYSRMPFNSFSDAFLIAAFISSTVASFSSSKVTSTREPVGTGTLRAKPVKIPSTSGITFPTALAAPVEVGIIFSAPILARRISFL